MAATSLSPPPINQPVTDGAGLLTHIWRVWLGRLYDRSGGAEDKADAAFAAAAGAALQTTEVVGAGGLQGGAALSGNVGITLYVAMTAVVDLPTTGLAPGDWAYAYDGRKTGEAAGAGTGVPVWWSKGAWCAVDSGAVVTS